MKHGSNWKGGSYKRYDGRTYIYTPDHPNAVAGGYVARYRLIVEEKIGRFLTSAETIHHINGNVEDDRIENLKILSHKDHAKLHSGKKHTKENIEKMIKIKLKHWEEGKYKNRVSLNQYTKISA